MLRERRKKGGDSWVCFRQIFAKFYECPCSLSLVSNDFHNKVPQLIAPSSVCFDFTKFLLLPPSQVTSKVNSQHFHSRCHCPQFGWMSCRICTSTWFSGGFIIDNFEYFYGQLGATAAARLYYVIRRTTPSPTSSCCSCSNGLARGNWPLRRASRVPGGTSPSFHAPPTSFDLHKNTHTPYRLRGTLANLLFTIDGSSSAKWPPVSPISTIRVNLRRTPLRSYSHEFHHQSALLLIY